MSDTSVLMSINVLQALSLGFCLGASGQVARVLVGLKKTHDEAVAKHETFAENFNGSELLVSLLIGGVAGTFAMIPLLSASIDITQQSIIMLIAAGYAGADFIEGFISRSQPASGNGTPAVKVPESPSAKTPEAPLSPPDPHAASTPEANIAGGS